MQYRSVMNEPAAAILLAASAVNSCALADVTRRGLYDLETSLDALGYRVDVRPNDCAAVVDVKAGRTYGPFLDRREGVAVAVAMLAAATGQSCGALLRRLG